MVFKLMSDTNWLLFSEVGRYGTATVSLCLIFILRLPAFFDYKVIYLPGCPNFEVCGVQITYFRLLIKDQGMNRLFQHHDSCQRKRWV